MATFHLKILTPESTALDASVLSIIVPGEDGYLGALSNHAPIISTLKGGRLKIIFDNKTEKFFDISGGILKIVKNEAVILTESMIEADSGA